MGPAFKPSQRAAILGVVAPQSASTAKSSGWIDASAFYNFMAIVQVGALGTSATVDAKIEQATSNAGAGAKDVTGRAITQFTKAGTDDDKQAIINVAQTDLDFANGFKFFRLTITPAVATSLIAGQVLGFDPRNGVASENDAASVDEIVG